MKKLILLFIPFILTGCTVNYELNINSDLSVDENITVLNDASYFDREGNVLKNYQRIIDIGMETNGYLDYRYLVQDDLYGGKAVKSYSSLEAYQENAQSYKNIYEAMEINRDGNIITLKTAGEMYLDRIMFIPEEETMDNVIPENTYFSIKLPFEVVNHNADRIDSDYNIYYWDIDINTTKDKMIEISFDTTKNHTSMKKILEDFDYTIVIIIGIIVIVICFLSDAVKKKNENNRI